MISNTSYKKYLHEVIEFIEMRGFLVDLSIGASVSNFLCFAC